MPARAAQDLQAWSLGDESFMSAADLLAYRGTMSAASDKATRVEVDLARSHLVRALSQPVVVTPDLVCGVAKRLMASVRSAVARGETRILLMRFPAVLCTDRGSAVASAAHGWADTLTGRPRQVYEFWRDYLRPQNYRLEARAVACLDGPADVGLFLSWPAAPPGRWPAPNLPVHSRSEGPP